MNGKIGDLKAVYTGAYLVRNVEQVQDYTNYARGPYVATTTSASTVRTRDRRRSAQCYLAERDLADERNTHQSHEFRLSTPDDWRMRAIGGAFWEDYKIQDRSTGTTRLPSITSAACTPPIWRLHVRRTPPAGGRDASLSVGIGPCQTPTSTIRTLALRDRFFDDITRGYTQKAAFTSVDFDIIPKKLTLTAGTRYYSINSTEVGSRDRQLRLPGLRRRISSAPGAIRRRSAAEPDLAHLRTVAYLDSLGFDKTYSGFKSRANLT